MMENKALNHAIALIKCESVTPVEGGALDYLQSILEKLGFRCTRLPFHDENTPDVDNLYARIGSSSPHICFAGHTDVVPAGDKEAWSHDPFKGEIENDILFGRGSADMKGGIACFLAAVEHYLSTTNGEIPGSVSFLITGDEEGPAINGTKKMLSWLTDQGELLDDCIVGEPSNPAHIGEMIKIGRRGSLNGTITILGKQGHVAYQHLANNPIEGLAKVIDKILSEPLDGGTPSFMPSNLEFTNIEVGNEAVNVIPARASARFNIRFNDAQTPKGLEKLIVDKTNAALARGPFSAEFAFALSGESFVTESADLTRTLVGAINSVTGRSPELSTSGGTSDARFIKDYCPVIEFGLVNATIHQVDEQVPVEHINVLTRIYARFLEDYFR